jgi:hypothetical protein
MQPPQGIGDKLRALGKLKSLADSRPRSVSSGPCQELVLDQPDLDRLPIATCWPGDGGPFITLPSVFTKDPHTGGRNVGMYRLQKRDAASTGLHWQIHKDAAADWREGAGRMEVAVSIGSDPITAYAGSCPAPKHVDELMIAGFLRGKAVDVVQCKTVDLQVPARAEIVLEGYCERGELADEGPFGDHTGYYTPPEPFPVLRLTCMTMRRDAIYPSILVGPPPAEDAWLGKATERLFLPALRATLPEIVDYDLPVAGAFHNCCIVSIRKAYPGHARKVMHAVWGTGLLSLTKKHPCAELEKACEIALLHGCWRLRAVRQLLGRKAAKQEPLPFLEEHPIIRPMSDYGAVVARAIHRQGNRPSVGEGLGRHDWTKVCAGTAPPPRATPPATSRPWRRSPGCWRGPSRAVSSRTRRSVPSLGSQPWRPRHACCKWDAPELPSTSSVSCEAGGESTARPKLPRLRGGTSGVRYMCIKTRTAW